VLESSFKIARILVVSRDTAVLEAVWSVAGANRWQTEVAADIWDAMEKVYSPLSLDLLALDLSNDPANCAQLSKTLSRVRPQLPVVFIGRSGELDRNPDAARAGAGDYLARPLQKRELEAALRKNLSGATDSAGIEFDSSDVESVGDGGYFIGVSPVMRKLRTHIDQLAGVDAPVLFVGETGSGRETAARLLHKLSVRSGFEFVRVNCAALPEELLEKEIFGCATAGNGASGAKCGKLASCDRGTIFLDEITELPLRLQEKLVNVIRDGRFGAPADQLEMDARLVATSTIALDQAVAEHRLLLDLAREFSGCQVHVPSLRERREELPLLSRHFMHQLARRYSLPPRDIAHSVGEAWQAHHWPGNLTELEEQVKRYMVAGEELHHDKLPPRTQAGLGTSTPGVLENGHRAAAAPTQSPAGSNGHKSLRSLLRSVKEEAERSAIARALEETGWNRKAAARLLKTSYRTVLYKIEQYQMTASDTLLLANNGSFDSRKIESQNAGRESVRIGSSHPGA
jgi:DNA-binding NtrC family response regulator